MRKLASVQRIWKIEPIEGADRIELAYVLGWQCVVNKGQFQPMDIAVYFEIDSFLPIRDEFEFMRSSSYQKTDIMGEGFRLRTMRFRGQISQGLLLPISQFPEIPKNADVGDDVTELLGVRKWEIEERATTGGTVIGTLPYDIPHTDETRVQEAPELIQAFAGLEYYISTKMDGSSHSMKISLEAWSKVATYPSLFSHRGKVKKCTEKLKCVEKVKRFRGKIIKFCGLPRGKSQCRRSQDYLVQCRSFDIPISGSTRTASTSPATIMNTRTTAAVPSISW